MNIHDSRAVPFLANARACSAPDRSRGTLGLFAGNGQAAQGMGMIVFPFAFLSSAYVPVSSMPGWMQVFARHQPATYMVDAVRALTLGSQAESMLGHPAAYFVTRALLWAFAIFVVCLPLAVAKYRRG